VLAPKAFFSFLELTDPGRHREFNQYHQLDHRPENLALPGVVWGDRWVRTPECAATSRVAEGDLDRIHYVTMYWFADPVEESVSEWNELGRRAFQWGRMPGTDWTRREVGFFRPAQGYVNPRVRVSADALVFRPVRGMHLTVSLMLEPHSAATEEAYSWYDRVHIPDLLSCTGVAGAWTFYSEWTTLLGESRRRTPGGVRVTLLYLDADPSDFLADRDRREPQWQASGRLLDTTHVEQRLLDTTLRPIAPWEWDWFDRREV